MMLNRLSGVCGTITCFTIIWPALISLVLCQDCSTERYDKCMNAFKAGDPSNSVVPWYSRAVLVDICSRLQALRECMHNVVPYCSTSTKLIYEGAESGYNFLCNSGYDEYIGYQPCFSDPNVQREGAGCVTAYNNALNAVFNNSAYDNNYKRDRLCQYSNTYVACMSNAIASLCNTGAALWQQTFDTKQLCPLLSGLQCSVWTTKCDASTSSTVRPATASTGNSSSLSTSVLVILVCLVIVALIIIIGSVIVVVICRLRPRRARTVTAPVTDMDPTLFGDFGPTRIELPPPYSSPFACREQFTLSPDEETSRPPTTSQTCCATSAASNVGDNAVIGAAKLRAYATAENNGGRISEDGFFVPESADMDAKLDDAIPPPPLSVNRHFDNCGFIPDDNSDTYEYIEAASTSSMPSTSPPVASPHQEDHRRFQLHNLYQHPYHDRHYEPAGGSRGSHDVKSRSSRSTPSVDRQLQYTSGRESVFCRPSDVSTSEILSSNASDASIGSMYSGTTSASGRSTSPLMYQLSANTSMTSSNPTTSPATYDNLQPSDDDIDYY